MAKKQTTEVANGKIRIRLKAYDPQLLEQSADKFQDLFHYQQRRKS